MLKDSAHYLLLSSYRKVCCPVTRASGSITEAFLCAVTQSDGCKTGIFSTKNTQIYACILITVCIQSSTDTCPYISVHGCMHRATFTTSLLHSPNSQENKQHKPNPKPQHFIKKSQYKLAYKKTNHKVLHIYKIPTYGGFFFPFLKQAFQKSTVKKMSNFTLQKGSIKSQTMLRKTNIYSIIKNIHTQSDIPN